MVWYCTGYKKVEKYGIAFFAPLVRPAAHYVDHHCKHIEKVEGVVEPYTKAIAFWTMAAEQGGVDAMLNLPI